MVFVDKSRLRPYIADDAADGPQTVLVIKGFSGPDEIQAFMDALLESGAVVPNKTIQQ